jgi:hypothetical protein
MQKDFDNQDKKVIKVNFEGMKKV